MEGTSSGSYAGAPASATRLGDEVQQDDERPGQGCRDLPLTADRPAPGLAVVRVRGVCDHDTAPALSGVLRRQLTDPPQVLVVDLSGVTFLGARGVDAVVEGADEATASGVAVRVLGRESAAAVRGFGAVGLLDLLDPHPDAEGLVDDLTRARSTERTDGEGGPPA
jgi:anti-sigma B factor antagonist